MQALGHTACDTFFILRSTLYLFRIMFICHYVQGSKLDSLSIRLNQNNEEDFRRSSEMAKIRYKYRPTMTPLIEEDDEDDEEFGCQCPKWTRVLIN